jgi:hypothetical protein
LYRRPPHTSRARTTLVEDVDPKEDDLVDQASMDSFPASDPPSFWAREVVRPDRAKAPPLTERSEATPEAS